MIERVRQMYAIAQCNAKETKAETATCLKIQQSLYEDKMAHEAAIGCGLIIVLFIMAFVVFLTRAR